MLEACIKTVEKKVEPSVTVPPGAYFFRLEYCLAHEDICSDAC